MHGYGTIFRLLATHSVVLAIPVHSLWGMRGLGMFREEVLVGSYYQLSPLPAIVCLIVHDPLFPLRRFMMFVLIFLHVVDIDNL